MKSPSRTTVFPSLTTTSAMTSFSTTFGMRKLATLLSFVVFVAGIVHAQSSANCTFQTFNPPSNYIYGFYPNGINDQGTIVGEVWGPSQNMGNAFIGTAKGNITVFDVPNASWTMFNRANAAAAVGAYGDGNALPPPGVGSNGLIYSSKSYATLNFPGSSSTELTGINMANTIVGIELDPTTKGTWGFSYHNGKFQQIRYPGSVQTTVTGINNDGVIVGGYELGSFENPWSGYVLENGKFTSLNFPSGYVPRDINDDGTMVSGNLIRFSDGTIKIIYLSGSAGTSADGINNQGVITGSASYGTFEFVGFTAECK